MHERLEGRLIAAHAAAAKEVFVARSVAPDATPIGRGMPRAAGT
jgi:hypothetical protein